MEIDIHSKLLRFHAFHVVSKMGLKSFMIMVSNSVKKKLYDRF